MAALDRGDTLVCNDTVLSATIAAAAGAGGADVVLGDGQGPVGSDGTIGADSTLTVNGGRGIAVGAGSKVTVDADAAISTTGTYAYGIHAVGDGSTILLDGGAISTGGEGRGGWYSYGVYLQGDENTVTLEAGSIATLGSDAATVYVVGDRNTVTVDGARLSTTGETAAGIRVLGDDNVISLTDTQITTSNRNGWGVAIWQGNNSDITLDHVTIQTAGPNAHNILLNKGSGHTVHVSESALYSADGSTVVLDSGGDVHFVMDGGSITNAGATKSAIVAAGESTSIRLDRGTVTALGADGYAVRMSTNAGVTDTLAINTAVSITGRLVADGGGRTFMTLTGEGVGTLSGPIIGFDGITKDASGTWVVDGDITDVAAVDVTAGAMLVNGNAGGSLFTVDTGGLLGGSGFLGNAAILAGGTLAAGTSIGTLTVGGDVSFAGGSVLQVELDDAGDADLVASGTAHIDGGTVHVLAANRTDDGSTYDPSKTYTILTAADGVAGTFEAVTDDFAFLDAQLAYDANNVLLSLTRNATGFDDLAGTPNQTAAASGLESWGEGEAHDAVLPLDRDAALDAFDQLSGEIHASIKSATLVDSAVLRGTIGRHVDAALRPALGLDPRAPRGKDGALWAESSVATRRFDGDGNAADFGDGSGTVLTGADISLNGWLFGLMAGYSRDMASVPDRASSADIDSYHVGFYGGTRDDRARIDFGLTYSYHDISTTRAPAYGDLSQQLQASYGGSTLQAYAGYEGQLSLGHVQVQPYANAAIIRRASNRFSETGGSAALDGAASAQVWGSTELGLRAGYALDLEGGSRATLNGGIGWRHTIGGLVPTTRMAFAGGHEFTIAGVPMARDMVLVEAGLALQLANQSQADLRYRGDFGAGDTHNRLDLTLSRRF
ncbi:autotransporter outer membrane beta-barrel domain-containing protein [Rhizobium halophytocola]|uniref:Outer membrane autotransporter protein n=1 Tax=Rhizobium halophytocola TaxID=735519 RepID=A0ABS4DWT5_9HYPH|nr:autotransporter domain-containing protein [Rhizobium halophytocola]MBP1850137.1 outer membrane autotransporter protein [Rhizobium halophytocola]